MKEFTLFARLTLPLSLFSPPLYGQLFSNRARALEGAERGLYRALGDSRVYSSGLAREQSDECDTLRRYIYKTVTRWRSRWSARMSIGYNGESSNV